MTNRANVLIVVCLGLTLLSKSIKYHQHLIVLLFLHHLDRLLCLLYSIFIIKNEIVEPKSIKSIVYFELPFFYLNMATVVHFFEW